MKTRETIWELMKRLDEQAGAFNNHLHQANHLFDAAAVETNKLLDKHQRDLHKTITKLHKAIKALQKKKKAKNKKDKG